MIIVNVDGKQYRHEDKKQGPPWYKMQGGVLNVYEYRCLKPEDNETNRPIASYAKWTWVMDREMSNDSEPIQSRTMMTEMMSFQKGWLKGYESAKEVMEKYGLA